MFDRIGDFIERSGAAIRRQRFRVRYRLARYARAWRYAINSLSTDEAQEVLIDRRYPAGWHSLVILSVDDAMEQVLEQFMDHPELRRLVADGCARVGQKWEDYGDARYAAQDWAIQLAQDYAESEGVVLTRREDAAADDADPAP